MHPIVADVLNSQLASLRRVYWTLWGVGLLSGLVLGVLEGLAFFPPLLESLWGLEIGLAAFAVLLLGVGLPWLRHRLLDVARVRAADPTAFQRWGLPDQIDPIVARQALFLTRATAGLIIGWGLCLAVGFYGLLTRFLGAPLWLAAGFLAGALLGLGLTRLQRDWLRLRLEELASPAPE